jgi:hypothetical protein
VIEEEKYLEIREKLRNLPKVKASDDFFAKLQSKISEIESTESAFVTDAAPDHRAEGGFFQRLFDRRENPWLIPASGFALVLLVAGIFYFSSADRQQIVQETDTETLAQVAPEDNSVTGTDANEELKQMKTESVPPESIAENTQEAADERTLSDQVAPVAPTESSVQPESRTRPEVKMEVETAIENEEKIRENFQTSAMEKTEAKSSNQKDVSVTSKKEDTNKTSLRSRRSPVQVSTIKQIELESLKEKISD